MLKTDIQKARITTTELYSTDSYPNSVDSFIFRGYSENSRKWVTGNHLFNGKHIIFSENQFFEVPKRSIGISTPFADMNGEQIFQGDLMRLTGHVSYVYTVVYSGDGQFEARWVENSEIKTLKLEKHLWFLSTSFILGKSYDPEAEKTKKDITFKSYYQLNGADKKKIGDLKLRGFFAFDIANLFGVEEKTVLEVFKELNL